jgi:hypothetical protein
VVADKQRSVVSCTDTTTALTLRLRSLTEISIRGDDLGPTTRLAVLIAILLAVAGCHRSQPASVLGRQDLYMFYSARQWIPLREPDPRFSPGSIVTYSAGRDPQWQGSLGDCGLPSSLLNPLEGQSPQLRFDASSVYSANAVLKIKGVTAGPEFSKIATSLFMADTHGPVSLDMIKIALWLGDPENKDKIPLGCKTLLNVPNAYVVREAYAVSKGKYVLEDKTNRQLWVKEMHMGALSIAEDARARLSPDGSLAFDDTLYVAVRTTKVNELSGQGSMAVYNAVFSSRIAGSQNGLADRKAVDVRFYIGGKDPLSVVPSSENAINTQLSKHLLVTLSCVFCDGARLQKGSMVWSREQGKSTMVTFTITPDVRLTRNASGTGDLVFQITGSTDGVLYDNVVVPVYVAPGKATEEPFVQSTERASGVAQGPSEGSRYVDLTLSCFDSSGRVAIQLNPTDPELARRFGERHRGVGHAPRQFVTDLSTSTLANLVATDYATLYSVVENDAGLQKALNGDPSQVVTLASIQNVMNGHDRDALLNAFHSIGRDLYRRLFLASDSTLADLAEILEEYEPADHRPIRIRIESEGVFVPWQFLHPLQGTMDPKKFWGFRYELVVDPQGTQPSGNYPGPMRYASGPLILAIYSADQSDSEGDREVATLGEAHYEFLKSQITNNVIKVDTRQGFIDALKQRMKDVQLIVAYTHADNGTVLQTAPGGEFTVTQLASDAKLRFKKDQFLKALDLDGLPSILSMPRIELSERPLVILNGCETSGGGYFATRDLNFPAIFLHFGARGVIATEAPVWDMFGHYFGKSLLSNLKSGEPVSMALLNARKEWLRTSNNPLGLLYSYYGGVDASVRF